MSSRPHKCAQETHGSTQCVLPHLFPRPLSRIRNRLRTADPDSFTPRAAADSEPFLDAVPAPFTPLLCGEHELILRKERTEKQSRTRSRGSELPLSPSRQRRAQAQPIRSPPTLAGSGRSSTKVSEPEGMADDAAPLEAAHPALLDLSTLIPEPAVSVLSPADRCRGPRGTADAPTASACRIACAAVSARSWERCRSTTRSVSVGASDDGGSASRRAAAGYPQPAGPAPIRSSCGSRFGSGPTFTNGLRPEVVTAAKPPRQPHHLTTVTARTRRIWNVYVGKGLSVRGWAIEGLRAQNPIAASQDR